MNREHILAELQPFMRIEEEQQLATIRLSDEVLGLAEDVGGVDALQHLLAYLGRSAAEAILCLNSRNSLSPERCNGFWERIAVLDGRQTPSKLRSRPLAEAALSREENSFAQLICWLRSVSVPVIMAFQGHVELPFLGLGLACDYRVVAADTVFHNRCHAVSKLHP